MMSLASLPLMLAPIALAGDPPSIGSTSASSLERSGRLEVFGSGFGAPSASSRLEIAGIEAIVTTWSPTEIHGYVPETAPLGATTLDVVTSSGTSNSTPLTVLPRVAEGHVGWRFQMDSNFAGRYVARAGDGTVYVTDDQRMYALSPDGGLLWVAEGAGDRLPISVANDGTIYTWAQGLHALNPDGTSAWSLVPPAPLEFMIAGPNLGPDGNLYGVQDPGASGNGLGVFSVDPSGSLRWSTPGDPQVWDAGGAGNTPVEFGSLAEGRLVFGNSGSVAGLPPFLYGFDFAGQQQWLWSDSCSTFPRVDQLGRVAYARSGSCGITVLDTVSGTKTWNAAPPQTIISTVGVALGQDGTVYSGDFAGKLWSVDASGNTNYFVNAPGLVSKLSVSPDNARLLEGQDALRAFDATDGSFLWEVDLLSEGGFSQIVQTYPGPFFTPDSETAYVTTGFTGSGPGYSYLMSIDMEPQTCQADVGFGGPGASSLSLCGGDLSSGTTADLLLTGAAPNQVAFLGVSSASNPTSILGGTVVPAAPMFLQALSTDAQGSVLLSDLNGGGGPLTLFAQVAYLDPAQPQGWGFSNALEIQFLP